MARIERGVIGACGPDTPEDAAAPLLPMAELLGWPCWRSRCRDCGGTPGGAFVAEDTAWTTQRRKRSSLTRTTFLRNDDGDGSGAGAGAAVRCAARVEPLLQNLQRYTDVPQIVVTAVPDGGTRRRGGQRGMLPRSLHGSCAGR